MNFQFYVLKTYFFDIIIRETH